ncbi:MAG: ATP phosphoribosyltransferase [Dehalococcoidia bacterium]|nr:ATP phosphoribosyltransferase [Dehalococcoidia bacterium]
MIRLALPAGDLREPLGDLLRRAGLPVDDYVRGSRSYVVRAAPEDGIRLRVFREKDIPIQIALGNYDLGICGLAWVEDLIQRYPSDAVVPVRDLGLGYGSIYVAAAEGDSLAGWAGRPGLRIVSEFPNLAEAFARRLRLPAYRVFPVWGAAEVYPPEDADLAVIAAKDEDEVRGQGLMPVHRLLEGSAWLVANRESLARKDLSAVLEPLLALGVGGNGPPALSLPVAPAVGRTPSGERSSARREDVVRLALPDGHQQKHTAAALAAAGLRISGYDGETAAPRPRAEMPGLEVKVIRPQDMPQQVALGHFDLAISGRDWLRDHRYQFPASPVEEVVDLGVGRYSIAAVVSEDSPARNLEEALGQWRKEGRSTVRVASEYVNIADHCARSRHLPRYKVIPISGASEGFVPEDAEVLIEGTETGATLAANRLKVIERIFESTTCLIAHQGPVSDRRRRLQAEVVEMFRRSAAGARA